MVALLVVVMIIAFITADVGVRFFAEKRKEKKLRREREEALDIGLKLEFTDDAKSLKRVEVDKPKARILAVDDEAVVLDSFRKILVLAGYNVDTVETGQEALGLIKKNDYDFVFTDLKMPTMDGLEVTKAVKHLRPDIDVIMITGYATIETAVDAMKYGALDYVQKPFTEDELVDFVNKSLIRRQDKIEKQKRPTIHLVTPSEDEDKSKHVLNVPAGLFISPQHEWLSIEATGAVRIGLDDFVQKTIGTVDVIELPKIGKKVNKGEPLFTVKRKNRELTFPSPVSGAVTSVNTDLLTHTELFTIQPYEFGWVCCIEANNLTKELQSLKIGADTISWYQEEIDKLKKTVKQLEQQKQSNGSDKVETDGAGEEWEAFSKSFLSN